MSDAPAPAPDHPAAPLGLREASAARLADDRRTCGRCAELVDGWCLAARRGALPHAARWLAPAVAVPHRCLGYRPRADDPDQRPAARRWPGLARRAGRTD